MAKRSPPGRSKEKTAKIMGRKGGYGSGKSASSSVAQKRSEKDDLKREGRLKRGDI